MNEDGYCRRCNRMWRYCDLYDEECALREYPHSAAPKMDKWRAANDIAGRLNGRADQVVRVADRIWDSMSRPKD